MKKLLLVLLVLTLIILPVSAALINTTVISNAVISASLGTEFSGDSFLYIATSPIVIQELKVSSYNDNIPTHVSLKQSNNNIINFDITTHAISWFQRQQIVNIAGGTSSTETLLSFLYPVNRIFFAQTNATPKTYYLIITDLSNFNDLNSYTFDLDTIRDAYLILPTRPSSNPVTTVSISSPGGRFSGTLYYVNVNSLVSSENAPQNLGQPGNEDIFWLIGQIGDIIKKILAFFVSVGSYIASIGGLVIFVLGAEIFLTLVAAYTIIALALSFHDSSDLFKSISKFFKYEMKLFRFLHEIFIWIKDTIKWW
jgi:hypothetical protein